MTTNAEAARPLDRITRITADTDRAAITGADHGT